MHIEGRESKNKLEVALYTVLFIRKECYLMDILLESARKAFHSYMIMSKSFPILVSVLPSIVCVITVESKLFR